MTHFPAPPTASHDQGVHPSPAPQEQPEPAGVMVDAPPTPYRCIKPQCPPDCSGCNHAVPGDDEALVLVTDLLNEHAVDGFGAPCEDGDSKLVDRARAFLRRGNRGVKVGVKAEPQEPQWGPILDALDGWPNDSRDEDYAHLASLIRREHARTLDRIDANRAAALPDGGQSHG